MVEAERVVVDRAVAVREVVEAVWVDRAVAVRLVVDRAGVVVWEPAAAWRVSVESPMGMLRAVRKAVTVRLERVTADPRSPVMLEQFRRVVVRDGAVREPARRVVAARVEKKAVEAWVAWVAVVEAWRIWVVVVVVLQDWRVAVEADRVEV